MDHKNGPEKINPKKWTIKNRLEKIDPKKWTKKNGPKKRAKKN